MTDIINDSNTVAGAMVEAAIDGNGAEGRHPTSQKFYDTLDEMARLHARKQADYGRADDPFANVRASEDFGVTGWVGTMMRANDKMRRIQTYAQGSELKNESVEDSLLDLAVYSIIALVLFREENSIED